MSVLRVVGGMLLLMGATGVVLGQTYPSRPIRIVTSEPGGNSDFTARLVARGLTSALGQSAIVDNRGGTITTAQAVAYAIPDGHTLLVQGTTFWIGTLLQKMPYDPMNDFSPITVAAGSPNVLVVHPSLSANSVKELIALAKTKPGELNYALSSVGGTPHLAAELFKSMADVNIVSIPYKGGGPSLNALISGEVQLFFAVAASAVPHIKSGRLRALAVTSAQPSALAPGLPTMASTLPNYETAALIVLFVPAKTPVPIIDRLNHEITRILNSADVKEKLFNAGAEVVAGSRQAAAITLKSEMVRMGKMIRDAGIKAE